MQDERDLVQRARQCDETAFTELYERHFDRIYRYVRLKVGNEMDAEDITQQVFLNALKSISSYNWKGLPFSSWLFRIAHNQIVDYHRKRSRRVSVPLDDAIPLVAPDNLEKMAEDNFDQERVMEAAKGLTDLQNEVISLRFAAELSLAEVARVMGKNIGAIKALQHSAIVSLRKKLVADTLNENI